MDTRKGLDKYKAAVIQAAPIFLDSEATVGKACQLIMEAASEGAQLVVFPETWVPGYPVWTNADSRWNYPPAKRVYRRLYENSVEIPGPATERLSEAARKAGISVVIGVHERILSGTLYEHHHFPKQRWENSWQAQEPRPHLPRAYGLGPWGRLYPRGVQY